MAGLLYRDEAGLRSSWDAWLVAYGNDRALVREKMIRTLREEAADGYGDFVSHSLAAAEQLIERWAKEDG